VRNVGTCPPMRREKSKWRPHEDERTEAGWRDGQARSSVEAWEHRGSEGVCLSGREGLVNPQGEELMPDAKPTASAGVAAVAAAPRGPSAPARGAVAARREAVGGEDEPDEARVSRPVL